MTVSKDAYFDSEAIGSSLLGAVITGVQSESQRDYCETPLDMLQINLDLGTLDINPTGFMEVGNIFEDLAQEEETRKDIFSDKYFKSDIELKPESAAWKKILKIFEETAKEDLPRKINNSYTFTKPDKEGNVKLHKTHKTFHFALDAIKAHECRRLIPKQTSDALNVMTERFFNAKFKLGTSNKVSLGTWFKRYDTRWQVEYFWEQAGANCRMKADLILIVEDKAGNKHAILFDLKVTAHWSSFEQNWRKRYIWQSKHYMEGFKLWCRENGFIPFKKMWYLVQESTAPFTTHIRALSPVELDALHDPYMAVLPVIQDWIDKGKPIKGYTEQETVDRFGRTA